MVVLVLVVDDKERLCILHERNEMQSSENIENALPAYCDDYDI